MDIDSEYDIFIDNMDDIAFEYTRIGLICKGKLYHQFIEYYLDGAEDD